MEVFDGGGVGGLNNWRSQIREEIRESRISVLSEALMQVLSPDEPETLTDLLNVAVRLESSMIFIVAVNEVDYNYMLYKRLDHLEDILSDDHFEDISSDNHFEDVSSDDHFDHFEDILSDDQMFEPSTATLLRGIFSDRQSQSIQVQSNLQRVLSSGNTNATAPIGNEEKPCCDDNDRISVLHESILHHIMSFMLAQDVVCTSMLFRRSRPLWTSAPCLDIDIDHFDMDRVKFNKFAKSLFERRGNANTLDTLRLHSFAIDAAKRWIDDAIRLHKVKSIDFTENTRWEAFYLDPKAINFRSLYLRSMKLTNVIIVTSAFDQLSRECPSLENLHLANSTLCCPEVSSSSLETLEISSSSLKTLEIINCLVLNHLLIRTRKLASLCFKDTRCGCSPKYIVRTTSAVILGDLSNAKSIELRAPVRHVAFDRVAPRRPMFISLTSLILGEWCLSNKLAPLACFLEHSPMLENLDLKLKFDCEEQKQPLRMPEGISFQAERLKKITIHCAEKEDRLPVLKAILLANARSVKHIDVKTYS